MAVDSDEDQSSSENDAIADDDVAAALGRLGGDLRKTKKSVAVQEVGAQR